jgi:hypothetical protein
MAQPEAWCAPLLCVLGAESSSACLKRISCSFAKRAAGFLSVLIRGEIVGPQFHFGIPEMDSSRFLLLSRSALASVRD